MTLMKLHLVNTVNKKKQTFSEPTDTQGFIIDENCMFWSHLEGKKRLNINVEI